MKNQIDDVLTRSCPDELKTSSEGGLNHLPCINATFGFSKVEEGVWYDGKYIS